MRRAFEEFMYGLSMPRDNWIERTIARIVAPIWYRYYCPYPLSRDWTARRCNERGDCGCNNRERYSRTATE